MVLYLDRMNLYAQYKALTEKEEKVIFGSRLGEYKYYDMDAVIASVLEKSEKESKSQLKSPTTSE